MYLRDPPTTAYHTLRYPLSTFSKNNRVHSNDEDIYLSIDDDFASLIGGLFTDYVNFSGEFVGKKKRTMRSISSIDVGVR